jgi:hypothetical protein
MAETLTPVAAFFCVVAVGLRLCAAGDEGRKTIDLIAFGRLRRRLRLRAIVAITIAEVLLARLLLFARIGLLLAGLELRLLLLRGHEARFCAEVGIAVAILAVVVECIAIGALHRLLLLLRLALAKLFLCRGDQAEIMFGVLVVVLGRDRIAGGARIACELKILFRNVGSGPANLDIRPVGLEHPGHRVLAAPVVVIVIIVVVIVVPAAHALVVVRAVSHVVPFTDSGSW